MHIYATPAEKERDFISPRTKTAMALAKAKYGTKYGGARTEAEARHKAVHAIADQNALRVSKFILDNREAGRTCKYIADHLNQLSVPTIRGAKWYDTSVQRYDLRLAS